MPPCPKKMESALVPSHAPALHAPATFNAAMDLAHRHVAMPVGDV
ncbi:MAG: hypothetical protein WB644_11470 [Candidatus Cybelea sp.]